VTDSIDIQRTLVRTIHNLYSALLCGQPTPLQRSILDYMTAPPRPGDLVMEISTIYMAERAFVRLGRLVKDTRELDSLGRRRRGRGPAAHREGVVHPGPGRD
jgi:hypothetical protein